MSSSLELEIHRVWIQKGGGKCLSDRSHYTEMKRCGGCTGYSKPDEDKDTLRKFMEETFAEISGGLSWTRITLTFRVHYKFYRH